MDNDKFQDLVLKKLEEQDKFQDLVIKHFGEIQNQFGEIQNQFGEIQNQFGEVQNQFGKIQKQFGEVFKKLEEHDVRFDRLEAYAKQHHEELELVARQVETQEIKDISKSKFYLVKVPD